MHSLQAPSAHLLDHVRNVLSGKFGRRLVLVTLTINPPDALQRLRRLGRQLACTRMRTRHAAPGQHKHTARSRSPVLRGMRVRAPRPRVHRRGRGARTGLPDALGGHLVHQRGLAFVTAACAHSTDAASARCPSERVRKASAPGVQSDGAPPSSCARRRSAPRLREQLCTRPPHVARDRASWPGVLNENAAACRPRAG